MILFYWYYWFYCTLLIGVYFLILCILTIVFRSVTDETPSDQEKTPTKGIGDYTNTSGHEEDTNIQKCPYPTYEDDGSYEPDSEPITKDEVWLEILCF